MFTITTTYRYNDISRMANNFLNDTVGAGVSNYIWKCKKNCKRTVKSKFGLELNFNMPYDGLNEESTTNQKRISEFFWTSEYFFRQYVIQYSPNQIKVLLAKIQNQCVSIRLHCIKTKDQIIVE